MVSNVPVKRSLTCATKILIILGCVMVGCLIAAAIAIPTYILITEAGNRGTTTASTGGSIITGIQNYAILVNANGYHGVQSVRYYSATNTGSSMRIDYPIVYLSGTFFSGSYTNNAWYALHAGCGNSNGIASCTAVCKSLTKSYVGITPSCGSGYPGALTTYVNPDRVVYTSTDTVATPWNDYGTGSGCGNPMIYCECTL